MTRPGTSPGSAPTDSDRLIVFAYIALVLKFMFSTSTLIPWPGVVNTLAEGLFLFFVVWKLALQRYAIPQLLCVGAVLALCAYSSVNANYSSPLLSLLLLFGLQDVDLRYVLRAGYSLKALIIFIHVVCYIGLVILMPDRIVYSYRGELERHFFMLGHPNLFSAYVLWTGLEYLYVNYEKVRGRHIVVFLLSNLVFYPFTGSRTGLYTTIVVAVLLIINEAGSRLFGKILLVVSKYGFAVCSVLSVVLTVLYSPSLSGRAKTMWLALNSLLTGRLVFGAYGYHTFGYTWLGRTLSIPPKVVYNGHWMDGVIFDNSYQWLFVVYGSVFLILLSLAFFLTAPRMSNVERIVVIAYILYALMENYIVNVVVCFPLLLLGKYLYAPRLRQAESMPKERETPLWKRKSV